MVVSFRFSDQVKDVTNKETLLKSQLRRQSLNVAKLSSVSTFHTLLLIYTLIQSNLLLIYTLIQSNLHEVHIISAADHLRLEVHCNTVLASMNKA